MMNSGRKLLHTEGESQTPHIHGFHILKFSQKQTKKKKNLGKKNLQLS